MKIPARTGLSLPITNINGNEGRDATQCFIGKILCKVLKTWVSEKET